MARHGNPSGDMPVTSPRCKHDGFTLVELLVVILIMGVVGGVTVRALVGGYRTSTEVQGRLDTQAELQDVQIDITRRLRAACPTIAIGDYATEVQLRLSNGDVERYHFYLPGGEVLFEKRERWNGSSWQVVSDRPIADGIDNFTASIPVFTAMDEDGNSGASLSSVRSFRTELRRDVPDGDTVVVTTTSSLRNGGNPCPMTP